MLLLPGLLVISQYLLLSPLQAGLDHLHDRTQNFQVRTRFVPA